MNIWNTLDTPLKLPWNNHDISMKHLPKTSSNNLKAHLKHSKHPLIFLVISVELPQDSHETSLKHLWNSLETLKAPSNQFSLKLCWSNPKTSLKHPWTFIETPLKLLLTPLKYLWKSFNLPWNTLKNFFKQPWNFFEPPLNPCTTMKTFLKTHKTPDTPLQIPWNTLLISLKHPINFLQTPLKPFRLKDVLGRGRIYEHTEWVTMSFFELLITAKYRIKSAEEW